MSITKIDKPRSLPFDKSDYENKNAYLEMMFGQSDICCDVSNDTFSINVGTSFAYNGVVFTVDEEIFLEYDRTAKQAGDGQSNTQGGRLFYLLFDGTEFSLTQERPIGLWDGVKLGYYKEKYKYIGAALMIYTRFREPTYQRRLNIKTESIINLKTPYLGQIYIRLSRAPKPEFFYYGKWKDISSDFDSSFFRVEGGAAKQYNRGKQQPSTQAHSHDISYYNQQYYFATSTVDAPGENTTPVSVVVDSPLNITYLNEEENDLGPLEDSRPINESIELYMCYDEKC